MNLIEDVVVEAGSRKTGGGEGTGKRAWCKHAYKFTGHEGWFVKFVNKDIPLLENGSVFKEVHYEKGQYGNDIKQAILKTVPKPGSAKAPAGSQPTGTAKMEQVAQIIKKPYESKDHPIWFCVSYMKDLMEAKIEKASAKALQAMTVDDLSLKLAGCGFFLWKQIRQAFIDDEVPQGFKPAGHGDGFPEEGMEPFEPQEPANDPPQFDEDTSGSPGQSQLRPDPADDDMKAGKGENEFVGDDDIPF